APAPLARVLREDLQGLAAVHDGPLDGARQPARHRHVRAEPRHYLSRLSEITRPSASSFTVAVNGCTRRAGCSTTIGPPTNRMSVNLTVTAPCASTAARAAGKRENPRNTRPSRVAAARSTCGVHTFGYRIDSRQNTSASFAGARRRASSRSTSRISYAFDICATIRQLNGDRNDGIAATSTTQRLPAGGGEGGGCGHRSTMPA